MSLRILHVVTTPIRRGAEMFAADLVAALGGDVEQRVLLLRRGAGPNPRASVRSAASVRRFTRSGGAATRPAGRPAFGAANSSSRPAP
ncbi:MAG TPA: hypothetical protein VG709_00980, partial [Actinomycetota bacterium]|nr:hypothetical protein [Actinomycetota bacterium]